MKKLIGVVICGILLFSACTTTHTESNNNKTNWFEVTFKNYDATVLYYTSVEYGGTAVYQGETPTRPANNSYYYVFDGWGKPLTNITQNTIFIAQYQQLDNDFTITWVIEDESSTEHYQYGDTPYYKFGTPTKEPTDDYVYSFSHWYPLIEDVTCNQTYTAVFSQRESEPLVDNSCDKWLLQGQHLLADGSENNWEVPSEDQIEKKELTPIKLSNVKTIDQSLFNTLSTKNIKYLYKYEGVEFGTINGSWITRLIIDGKINEVNCSYVFSIAKLKYNSTHSSYTQDWIPLEQNTYGLGNYAESLTPETLYTPLWPKPEEYLSTNATVKMAGIFTLVVAEYDEEGPSVGTPNFGIAAILTESKEGIPIQPFPFAEHTYSARVMNGLSDEDIPLSTVSTNENLTTYSNTIAFQKDDRFAIRADSNWKYSWSYSNVSSDYSDENIDNGDGHIKIKKTGTYYVAIIFSDYSFPIISVYLISQ